MTDVVSFTASAALAGGVGAQVNVIVDGKVIGSATVGTATQTYAFNTTLATGVGHDIQIQYVNDSVISGADRNLYLKSIGINGQTVSATGGNEVYHSQAGGGPGDLAGNGSMYWNGAAEFSLPASMFPGSVGSAAPPPPPPPPPTSAAFYVSTSGSDSSGDGSAAHPFASLNKALSAMQGSSTVHTTYLEGGTYHLGSTVNVGSGNNGDTIASAPGQQAVLDGGGSLSSLISLNGATGVTVQGLAFQNTNAGSRAALVLNGGGSNHVVANHFANNGEGMLVSGSSNNSVTGNELDNSHSSAIEVQNGSSGNTFDSNLINGTGAVGTAGGGFFLHGASNNVISHNQVENTAGIGIGIENWDSSTVNVGNSVIDNVLKNNGTSSQSTDSGAIYMLGRSGGNTQTTISGNDISTSISGAGHPQIVSIYLDDLTSGVTITNNIVADTIDHSLQIHGGSNINVQNNIFDLGADSGSSWGWDTAVLFQSMSGHAMTNNTFAHNVIASTSPTPAAYANLAGGNPTVDGNFYMDLVNSHFQVFGDGLNETNAHSGNALFANQAAGNYAMASNSPALAAGFHNIDQSIMGLHPAGAHWYALPAA